MTEFDVSTDLQKEGLLDSFLHQDTDEQFGLLVLHENFAHSSTTAALKGRSTKGFENF